MAVARDHSFLLGAGGRGFAAVWRRSGHEAAALVMESVMKYKKAIPARQASSRRYFVKLDTPFMVHFTAIIAGLLILLAGLLIGGCAPAAQIHPTQVAERLPIITMNDTYPAGVTPEEFWGEKREFFKQYDARAAASQVTEAEAVVMRHLQDIEMLRRAGEAKIREYNKHAKERNRQNGY